jgi:hypothetical protein
MILTVEELTGITKNSAVLPINLDFHGCESCLEDAIVMLIVNDSRFREMINRCGAKANKIRRGEDFGIDINPSHN